MKNKINAYIVYSIFLIIWLWSIIIFVPFENNSSDIKAEENSSVKLSAGEITIITPENKTYAKPMDGYYPATYDFEGETDGTTNQDIRFIDVDSSGSGSYFEISSDFNTHNKVLKCVDGAGYSSFYGIHYFDKNTSAGTIEFWYAIDRIDILNGMAVRFYGDGGNPWYISCYKGTFRSNGWVSLGLALANTWYHIKMEYNCSVNKVNYYIDGEFKRTADFGPCTQIEYMTIDSDPAQNNFITGYLDAFGFSWDENYKIGDNLFEGLLLSFENSTKLDWTGYSLDNSLNKTIFGNSTISMPSKGTHSIQVFGNSSLGTMYQSEKRYFTINDINIISPDNKTYTSATSGYYPATYDFEDETDGTTNQDIRFIDVDSSGSGSYFEISSNFNTHNKVLKCVDGAGYSSFYGIHYFNKNTSTGTIEFWYAIDNIDILNGMAVRFYGDGGIAWYMSCYKGNFRSNGWVYMGLALANNWYHIKMEYNCSLGKVNYYIDGEFKRTADFAAPCTQIEYMTIDSDPAQNNFITGYLDAFGFSWDENYNIGDNLEEGLLLSYENSTNLDWTGYSLDNSLNKTIFGNSTISMPSNGTHSIQVFGNSSLGTMYQSEKRYFTMNYTPINLISPESNKTYTKAMFGYYPATYGFENDINETFPKEWINYPAVGCSIKVIDEFNSHKKIVKLFDGVSPNLALMVNEFRSPRISGTIEFWISTTDITQRTEISFRDMSGYIAFSLEIDDGLLRFWYDYPLDHLGFAITNDNWYHVRIEFNCSEYKVSSWLDGLNWVENGNFYQSISTMGKIRINTASTDAGYSTYLDAIGYSWYDSYDIGDNLNEGILLSFENSSILDWMGYSLDGGSKKSILGNTTLSVPEDGVHTIQVFGKDSLKNIHESELINFSIDMAPFVKWQSPKENQIVKLPPGDAIFEFGYTCGKLDDVRLEINGTDFGSVWNKTSTILTAYTKYTDGYVTAILHGYQGGSPITSDSRNFTLSKIEVEVVETLNSSTEVLGAQLYMIFHDPHGDNSYSSFSETSQISIGVGLEITTEVGMSVEIGEFLDLFGVEVGASLLLDFKQTMELGLDFRFEISDTTTLTSSQINNDPDYIGPGYGDRYWGEAWIFKWVLNASHRIYLNGTDRWEDPQFFYGIIRDVETFLSDADAPPEWRSQNAVHNDSLPVKWVGMFAESGGAPYIFEREVTTTMTRSIAFTIEFGTDFENKFPGVRTHNTFKMSIRNYAEIEAGHTHKVAYNFYDDDPDDYIVMGKGIDERFGTYIFNSSPFFCETSYPYEHNTYDYLPPIIDFPAINLDSDGDGYGPTASDSPVITVDIFEEGGVQEAIVRYSVDGGLNWDIVYLLEQPFNPGTWATSIPPKPYNTNVIWYIQVWDNQGNNAIRNDPYGNPYQYTVIKKPEAPIAIPIYPPSLTLLIVIISTIIIGIRIHRKHAKFKR